MVQRNSTLREIYFYDFRNVAELARRARVLYILPWALSSPEPFVTKITRKDSPKSRVLGEAAASLIPHQT